MSTDTEQGVPEIEFWDLQGQRVTASIHKKGKIGFSKAAEELMQLDRQPCFKVGTPKGDNSFDTIYLVETGQKSNMSLKVARAGNYYYLHIANVLDQLGIEYLSEMKSYWVDKIESGAGNTYKLSLKKTVKRHERGKYKKRK